MREPSNIATSTLPLVPGAGRKALAEHVLLVPLEKRQDDNKTQTLLLAGPSKRKATRSALTAIDKATKRAIPGDFASFVEHSGTFAAGEPRARGLRHVVHADA
ncbi:hypothetical protein PPROV_000972200 [Pycnococcus provasolii]|uniref:Uncharacterized protein n=1 Tax=Pycnococcus provasolii TaxID=41880 RepID=A0A830HV52_9CHLO|nr:hypothetical protein PPROV_000972200 [Pycnococcus provasolii]